MASPLTLKDFKASPKARPIGELLSRPETIGAMEALSRDGRPAVLALDRTLPREIALDDTEKKHVGRWIRDVLGDRGWRPRRRKPFRSGRIFSSGAVYERLPTTIPASPAADDVRARVRRARKIVASFRAGGYGVDDFISDKRAEAAHEL